MNEQIVLFDKPKIHKNIFPITMTRSIAKCIIGIDTIQEKWQRSFNREIQISTLDYLKSLYPSPQTNTPTLFISSNLLPNKELLLRITALTKGQGLKKGNEILCFIADNYSDKEINFMEFKEAIIALEHSWDIFKFNGDAIESDFVDITRKRKSQELDKSNTIIGDKNKIFLETGAIVRASVLNTEAGCIYIGKDAEVMEGSLIRGPFALGEHGVTKLGTKVYGPTTVGPYSKIGGEVNNSVIFSYSNKGHDGFLGNSVLGEWCNLGADTNNSNLKNNYGVVKTYSHSEKKEITTGMQFCGLIMGDHSKSGINTMFNTGTICGVSSNVFGGGFPQKHIRSFTWGGSEKEDIYEFEKAIEVANRMMERRGKSVSKEEKQLLRTIFNNRMQE